jgi:hypothetical protein
MMSAHVTDNYGYRADSDPRRLAHGAGGNRAQCVARTVAQGVIVMLVLSSGVLLVPWLVGVIW